MAEGETNKGDGVGKITYNPATLALAAKWVGLEDGAEIDELMKDEGFGSVPPPHPEGVGLGAKFAPHRKGVLGAHRVEQVLARKLRKRPKLQSNPRQENHEEEDIQSSKATTLFKNSIRLKKTDLLSIKKPSKRQKKLAKHRQ